MGHKPTTAPDTYWVVDGLLAGEYPGSENESDARARLRSLLDAGIGCFIDLTEQGEYHFIPYAPLLNDVAADSDVGYVRAPVRDLSVPTREEMIGILDLIDERIAQGQRVYVHCRGGIGRTGTVVGCYLARHGLASGDEVMPKIAELRSETRKRHIVSPEIDRQKEMVAEWRGGE